MLRLPRGLLPLEREFLEMFKQKQPVVDNRVSSKDEAKKKLTVKKVGLRRLSSEELRTVTGATKWWTKLQ